MLKMWCGVVMGKTEPMKNLRKPLSAESSSQVNVQINVTRLIYFCCGSHKINEFQFLVFSFSSLSLFYLNEM